MAGKLTVIVENNFVVHPARGMPALVLVDQVLSQFIQGNGVGYGSAENKQLFVVTGLHG